MNFQTAFVITILCTSQVAIAGGPNPNIKYYGYDWLDGQPGYSPTDAFNAISTTGFSTTNLNVVHNVENLNSPVCASNKCVLGIGAGNIAGSPWVDICPGAKSDSECRSIGSWGNIWNIAFRIGTASNKPSALYFIDEPFDNLALQQNGAYVPYIYSSYVCTLRQAMKAYGLNIPIYTVLSYRHSQIPAYVAEIRDGAPTTACPASDKSSPDWVGIDNYDWNTADIWISYNRIAPSTNSNSAKWVLVPPATSELGKTDEQLHAQIQLYWDFLYQHPAAPVIYIMNWRFDPGVTVNRSAYPKSSALLSFMGNTLTP